MAYRCGRIALSLLFSPRPRCPASGWCRQIDMRTCRAHRTSYIHTCIHTYIHIHTYTHIRPSIMQRPALTTSRAAAHDITRSARHSISLALAGIDRLLVEDHCPLSPLTLPLPPSSPLSPSLPLSPSPSPFSLHLPPSSPLLSLPLSLPPLPSPACLIESSFPPAGQR